MNEIETEIEKEIETQPIPQPGQCLIPVFTGEIGGIHCNVCDARTLHGFLRVGKDFSSWMKGRIKKYGFIEGVDFSISCSPNWVSAKINDLARGQDKIDYRLTLDTAKELAMVENNAQGRSARRYFIECERLALSKHFEAKLPSGVEKACDLVSLKYANQLQQQAMSLIGSAARPGDEDFVLNVTFLVKKRIYQQITQAAKKLLEDGEHEELVTDTILDWHSSPTVAPYAKLSILR